MSPRLPIPFRQSAVIASSVCIAVAVLVPVGAAAASRAAAEPGRSGSTDIRQAGGAVSAVRTRPVSAIVRLSGPSLLEVRKGVDGAGPVGATGTALGALREAMLLRQASVVRRIEQAGGRTIGSYQASLNALQVVATRDQLGAIAEIPGVAGIDVVPPLATQLDRSVPHIGADRVWQELGLDGSGVTIAVIDTGIDYTHLAFGGPGTFDAYLENDPAVVEPGSFPTAKVVGGYDFAGQVYSDSCPDDAPPEICSRTPEPDDDPLDGPGGHGTHVAGIAAGMTAEAIAPGVAPEAGLVALKVYGNPYGYAQSTTIWGLAVEWAVSHNLGLPVEGAEPEGPIQVLDLSVGGAWSGTMSAAEELVDAATEAGMTVVAAAGNSGNRPYIVSQPGSAQHAVSVAGSEPPGETALLLAASWTEDGTLVSLDPEPIALEGGADWLAQLRDTGPKEAPLAWYGLACDDADPAQDVSGRIALIERGDCDFYDKIWSAERRGALAVVVFTDIRDKAAMGCIPPTPCDNPPTIPGVMIDRQPGLELERQAYELGHEVTARLDDAHRADITDAIMAHSSRGPARADGLVKPQLTAPGDNIRSAESGSGNGLIAYSGTSMAAPFAAGTAALLWQRDLASPVTGRLGALGIAASIIAGARPVIRDGDPATGELSPVARQGAGLLDAYASAASRTVVRSEKGIAELSFGTVHVPDDADHAAIDLTQSLSVRNRDATGPKRFAIQIVPSIPRAPNGVSLSLPETVTVAAGQVQSVDARLSIATRQLPDWPMGDPLTLADEARYRAMESDGWVELTELDDTGAPEPNGDRLTIPWQTLARRHACVVSEEPADFYLPQPGATTPQLWRNPCLTPAPVQVYHLVGHDTEESATSPDFDRSVDITDIGVRWGPEPGSEPDSPPILEFAIRTAGARRTPFDTEFHVFVDVDGDGRFDEAILNTPEVVGADYTGRWMTAHAPVIYQEIGPTVDFSQLYLSTFVSFDLDESVIRLALPADEIGFEWPGGVSKIGLGVEAIAIAQDMPIAEGYVGRDVAPDDLPLGDAYSVDVALADCVGVAGMLGDRIERYGGSITVPPSATVETEIDLDSSCTLGPDQTSVALLYSYAANMPGGAQGEYRTGWFKAPPSGPSIYLPYAGDMHTIQP